LLKQRPYIPYPETIVRLLPVKRMNNFEKPVVRREEYFSGFVRTGPLQKIDYTRREEIVYKQGGGGVLLITIYQCLRH